MERMAQEHRQQLDELPQDVPGQIQGLQDYDFMDPNARQMFQAWKNCALSDTERRQFFPQKRLRPSINDKLAQYVRSDPRPLV